MSEEFPSSTDFRLKCRYRRALTLFDLKRYEEVVKDANEVLLLDVNNIPARALLGRSFKVIREYQKAEEQLNNAIVLDPNQAALYTGNLSSKLDFLHCAHIIYSTSGYRERRYSVQNRNPK